MAGLINLVVLLCASVAVFANPIELNELEIETSFLEDVIDPFAAGSDQSTVIGFCSSKDKLIHDETVDVRAENNQVKERDIIYFPGSEGRIIICIKILDQLRTGHNAAYNITKGDLGEKFVTIHMTSERGQPIKYVVQIFGR